MRVGSYIPRWLKWATGLLAGWFFLHTVVILWDGFSDEEPLHAVAVVPGNKVNEDGSLSPRLEARLAKALELYREGRVEKIVVSGGLGAEGHPEGSVMRAWLELNGVAPGDLITDDQGNTTWMTARNVQALLADRDREIVVVSQYYHLSRSKLALRKMGFRKVSGVHADFAWEWRDIRSVVREFFGYYSYLVRRN
jgi:uncharacterized SAM-binding protein YcdF (DUF218 family)